MAGKFELKTAKSGQFHFNLLAGNGQIIMQSEMYESKASALNGIASIQKNAADDARYDRLVSKSEKPYFVLKAGNHQVIGQSQMYESKASALNGIASIQKNAADDARYDRLVSKSEKPYFVLKAGNHQVIGQSQMYESEAGRDNGIESVKKNAPEATVDDQTA